MKNSHKLGLYKEEKQIVDALARNGSLTGREISKLLGLNCSLVYRKLRVLSKWGVIRIGCKKEVVF